MGQHARVLVAGATGYLGGYLLDVLRDRGYWTRALTRSRRKTDELNADETFVGEVTKPETLHGLADRIDIAISAIGITRQKDGLTYNDVDYRGNCNVLEVCQRAGVSKFIYVSAFGADTMRHLKIADAKERFADTLAASGMDYAIMRPNGYFSDITAFLEMAEKGRVYLFGDGGFRMNPIHGRDVARACVEAIALDRQHFNFGGPQVLTHREMAETAFSALGKPARITCLPAALGRGIIPLLRTFTSQSFYGPIEFLLTVLTRDMVGEPYGEEPLESFFRSEAAKQPRT